MTLSKRYAIRRACGVPLARPGRDDRGCHRDPVILIKQLTHLKGDTTELKVLPDGKATIVNDGVTHLLDLNTQTVKPL
jgi:hypothetical protein